VMCRLPPGTRGSIPDRRIRIRGAQKVGHLWYPKNGHAAHTRHATRQTHTWVVFMSESPRMCPFPAHPSTWAVTSVMFNPTVAGSYSRLSCRLSAWASIAAWNYQKRCVSTSAHPMPPTVALIERQFPGSRQAADPVPISQEPLAWRLVSAVNVATSRSRVIMTPPWGASVMHLTHCWIGTLRG
jgi:hypothetical protein